MALILVTGASTGLGLATAQDLSDQGHDVVVHARTSTRVPSGDWRGAVAADLSDLDATRALALEVDAFGHFDAVVHNAGALQPPDAARVNTIAPYVLTMLMRPPRRLVYLSSSMHRGGTTDLRGLTDGTASYSDSKLWVTAFALSLADRWPDTAVHAVDPGWVPTRMGGPSASDDLEQGHLTQVRLATQDAAGPRTGGYWHHLTTQRPAPAAADPAFQEALLAALAEVTRVPVREHP
ncbi:SDR family NAD(P)-dependent oxidoreductase [Microbacterium sp. Mcb102]|uniref:SDR family NAD(P)-dependent oxidoreductase n=1 Tax=Microbacterium sp. Mcb102 TaxID=2926012 RepID=UPI0021C96D17|nr:SDR family NAD(P)-dependent oxidoreductase [Microbacterium sp. Mcb102]